MERSWETHDLVPMLPQSLQWLNKIKFDRSTALEPGKWHVIFSVVAGDRVMVWGQLDQYCSNETITVLKNETQQFKKSGHFWINNCGFIIVALPILKVTKAQSARQAGLKAASLLANRQLDRVVIGSHPELPMYDLLEGLLLGFDDGGKLSHSKKSKEFPSSISTLGNNHLQDDTIADRVALVKSLILTKWLQNCPANLLGPESFASLSQGLLKEKKGVKCQVFGEDFLKEKQMGAFLAVSAGSKSEPKMIRIDIEGESSSSESVVLIGKGVTFDAGGVNIKPSGGLEEMKYDMSGGAAVLGAAYYFHQRRPKNNMTLLIGAVENLVSSTATRPGDVVTSYSGKTVEVANTDAEGRLVLADLLTYAQRDCKPLLIADIATLTGAVLHGLGSCGSAFLSHDSSLVSFIKTQSEKIGEPLWQLPMWPELSKELEGGFSDLKNITKANVKAGTLVGGVFLSHFVDSQKYPWVHIDIAGTAWSCTATGYDKQGGSAFGVRTLIALSNWQT